MKRVPYRRQRHRLATAQYYRTVVLNCKILYYIVLYNFLIVLFRIQNRIALLYLSCSYLDAISMNSLALFPAQCTEHTCVSLFLNTHIHTIRSWKLLFETVLQHFVTSKVAFALGFAHI